MQTWYKSKFILRTSNKVRDRDGEGERKRKVLRGVKRTQKSSYGIEFAVLVLHILFESDWISVSAWIVTQTDYIHYIFWYIW